MTTAFPQLQNASLAEASELVPARVLPMLTEQEHAQVRRFAQEIDIADPAEVSAYGAAEQGAMQTWLDVAIHTVAGQDLHGGERWVDKMIGQIRGFDRLCSVRRFLFGRVSFARLRNEYLQLEPAIENTANELLDQSVTLRRVSKVLERMSVENQSHLSRLSTYLLCGQVRLEALRAALPAASQSALTPASNLPAPADLSDSLELKRLERRMQDIAVTRQIALQTKAQLVLLLDGNAHMIETMERTLKQVLPLWKSQVLVSLGLAAQVDARARAEQARRALERDMTVRNSLLARLLSLLGVGRSGERQALRMSNERLLGSVTELKRSLSALQNSMSAWSDLESTNAR